jgi:hypothetical protein
VMDLGRVVIDLVQTHAEEVEEHHLGDGPHAGPGRPQWRRR